MTSQEIREKQFDRAMRGYKTEMVDEFLAIICAQMDNLAKEKEDSEKKLYILAQKVEQYRSEEDMLKTAMINAQRMGENVIKEAKQKAETIIREADLKAALIDGQAKAKVENKEKEYVLLAEKVSKFKSDVLSIYKEHIQALSELPVTSEHKEPDVDDFVESIVDENIISETPIKETESLAQENIPVKQDIPEEAFEEYIPPFQNDFKKEPLKTEFEGFDFEKAGKMIDEDASNNNPEIAKTFEFEPISEIKQNPISANGVDPDFSEPFFTPLSEVGAKQEKSENPMFNQYDKISFND